MSLWWGSADIQSLADLANSFEVVSEMRRLPFSKKTVLRLIILLSCHSCR
jgi:hypothetical protein